MKLSDAIKGRRSIRAYKSDPVPREMVLKVLDAANWAPSGMNLQQWHFIVAKGEMKDRIAQLYGKLTEANMPPEDQRTESQKSFLKWAKTLGGAPVVIALLTDKEEEPRRRKMHIESAAAAFQNLFLTAYSEGLGTCWMTGPLRAEAELVDILNVSEDKEIVAITPLGFPAPGEVEVPPRQDPDLKEKVTWVGF